MRYRPEQPEKSDLDFRQSSSDATIVNADILEQSLNPGDGLKSKSRFSSSFGSIVQTSFLILLLVGGCKFAKEQECNEKTQENLNRISDQMIKINIQGDLASIHPHLGIDLNCRSVQKALFEGLTRLAPSGKVELALAKEVAISPSHTIYTFTLRPSIWSNGQEVTANHFVSAWKRGIAPGSNCLRADIYYPIKNAMRAKKGEVKLEEVGLWAQDDKTLVIELEHPTPYFLELLSLPLYSPLYDNADEPIVFNGPFTINSWEHEQQLTLHRNPKYWDHENVKLDQILISCVHDPNTALLMYEKGELDWSGSPFTMLPPDLLPLMENEKKITCKPVAGVYWFSCNTESFPLNSPNIRKALSYVINRKELARDVVYGERPSRSLIPLNILHLNEDELYPDNDLTAAKAYFAKGLEELKITNSDFPTLKLSHSDIAGQKQLAEAVAECWEKNLGIKVELVGSDWNTFFNNLGTRQYQIGGGIHYSVVNDPIYILDFFKDKSHRYNSSQWENPQYKKLLDLADLETNLDIRKEHLRQAEMILLNEMPVIPVYISNHKYLVKENVKNVYISDSGLVDFKCAYVQTKTTAKS
jgi:oligopeptide transport system substrate-binding protein